MGRSYSERHPPSITLFLDSSTWIKLPGGRIGYIVRSWLPTYPYVNPVFDSCSRYLRGTVPHCSTMRPKFSVLRGSNPGSMRIGTCAVSTAESASDRWETGGALISRSETASSKSTPYKRKRAWKTLRYIIAKEHSPVN